MWETGGGILAGRVNLRGVFMKTVYTASKVKHAAKWRQMREEWPCKVISTWIDEADDG